MNRREMMTAVAALGAVAALAIPEPGHAADAAVIDARVRAALEEMFRSVRGSRQLAERARAVLMMPRVVEGGFILGGAYGEGGLLMNQGGALGQKPAAYYSMASASLGLQVGVQKSSHALFFMTDEAVEQFRRADGWEAGVDAEVTFPGAGLIAQATTTAAPKPVVGIVFGQDGLLVGASLKGAKYSPIVR